MLSRPRHNLPAELSTFIGREPEIIRLADRLGTARLLTLVGPGGVGKTRLALQIGSRALASYAEGVWLLELGPLTDPHMVVTTVAAALGVRERGQIPLARTLAETLRDQRLLLVLDNCEHVLDGCAELAHDLLRACPHLTILATSREPLRVSGEVRWPVPPLSVSFEPDASAQTSEAVQLFVERARAVNPDFVLAADNRAALGELCARLDGLPLAIELAAARIRSIPPQDLLHQLQSAAGGLPLLTGGPRDVPARHQTLQATIAWSYDLLEPEERTLFRRIAPFRGCTVGAVAAVCVNEEEGPRSTSVNLPALSLEARDGLASLVDKSLLRAEEDEQGQAWYVMLETVREFAQARLEASPEADAVWRRHAWYYLRLAEEQTAPGPHTTRQDVYVTRLEREHGNFRAALDWCQAHGYAEASLRLGVGLLWFWGVRGHIAEGRHRLESLLARFPLRTPTGSRGFAHAKALDALGRMAAMQGDLAAALEFGERSLGVFECLEHTHGICAALECLAFIARQRGDLNSARGYFERSLAALDSLGSANRDTATVSLRVNALANLGVLAHDQGDDDTAIARLEQATRLLDALGNNAGAWYGRLQLASVARDRRDYHHARALAEAALRQVEHEHDQRGLGLTLAELGSIATAQRDFASAHDFLWRSLRLNQEIGEPAGVALLFDRFAVLASAQGQHERALRLTGAAAALREQAGTPPTPAIQRQIDQQIEPARQALGRLAAAVHSAGQKLSLTEAIVEAQTTAPGTAAEHSGLASETLSPREQQVALLVGRGHTNRQIAAELTVSEGTVATHVQHILAKLDLHSRAQIAVWVVQNNLSNGANSRTGGDHAAVPG
jgi:predicted ATPase/DNA-binding CsgD family transcriptional regulator